MWNAQASTPEARAASQGSASPKSAIHPRAPVGPSIISLLMIPLVHSRAAGLVRSTMALWYPALSTKYVSLAPAPASSDAGRRAKKPFSTPSAK